MVGRLLSFPFGGGPRCSVCFAGCTYIAYIGFFEFSQGPTSLSYKVGSLPIGVEIARLIGVKYPHLPISGCFKVTYMGPITPFDSPWRMGSQDLYIFLSRGLKSPELGHCLGVGDASN